MTEGKNVLREEELDLVAAGGVSWICERTGIGTADERIHMKSISGPDKFGYVKTVIHEFGVDHVDEFRKKFAGDTFKTADGKDFIL